VGPGAKIGNFVELKKARIGRGAKVPHLSYVGDATLGPDVNIGAGAITCNYDGVAKHDTVIGAGAFIGTNASLVAPLTVGDGAYVGAGSVITQDVPPGALAVTRAPQVVREGWVAKKKAGKKPAHGH
jgi:bifunctional UDP-N-acetylglucosamine pyrophosphorylase/glucosamine-1-phosphate N-acetyltransferase